MKIIPISFLCVMILSGCNSTKGLKTEISKTDLTSLEMQTWHQKDYVSDGIPGISLEKWYHENKTKKNNSIIVALIDTQIDLKHEDLQGQFWTNSKEIPDNNIDDDHNGYIDDIQGWSFTGTKNNGYVVWSNYEYVRILRDWGPLYQNKTEDQISQKEINDYKEYLKAAEMFRKKDSYYKNWLKSLNYNVSVFPLVKDTLKYFFPKEDYTYQQLDSMYKIHKINDKSYIQRRNDKDKDLGALIDYMMINLETNQKTLEAIKDKQTQIDSVVNKNLNINYNERLSIGDNPSILEKGYGNNNISNTKEGYRLIQNHSTMMAGVIGGNKNNTLGVKGILQNVKFMPLNISPSGDEHDKDIAMAVYYAVDNGAKIINMPLGKEFSLHKQWIIDAFKYAEKQNVLIVHSAGNSGLDIDKNPVYPNDTSLDINVEFCNNFITVGSTNHILNDKFVSNYSNYGKENVDLFAPGEEIYTTAAGNSYKVDSGTSLSTPMVSGTAALIWTYYPTLTAKEVKEIILNSGTSYDLEVIIPGTKDKKIKFSELSKSGKVLNTYNAMILAKKVSKQKK